MFGRYQSITVSLSITLSGQSRSQWLTQKYRTKLTKLTDVTATSKLATALGVLSDDDWVWIIDVDKPRDWLVCVQKSGQYHLFHRSYLEFPEPSYLYWRLRYQLDELGYLPQRAGKPVGWLDSLASFRRFTYTWNETSEYREFNAQLGSSPSLAAKTILSCFYYMNHFSSVEDIMVIFESDK